MDLFLILIGLIFTICCGSGLWWLIHMLLGGISTGNLVTIVGGGILAYLFFGLLVAGLIVGLALFVGGIFE